MEYRRPVDNLEMIEVRPNEYLNRTAFEAGYYEPQPRGYDGEVQNVPVGNSLTPWRAWGSEADGWYAKRSWL